MWSYNGNDSALDSAGNILAGRVFTVWTAETGGTQLTSTVRSWAGSTVSSGQITSEADGRIRFKETSDTYQVLWLKAPDSNMYPVVALEAVGTGGGGGVSLSANNAWTGVQTFSTNPVFNDAAIPQAKVNGLGTALAAAANPVYRGAVANQAAMLALSADPGDSVKRDDTGSFWFLWSGTNPDTLGNWVEVSAASSSTSPFYVWRYTAGAWPTLPATKPPGVSVLFAIGPTYPTVLPSWTGLGAAQIPVAYSKVDVE